MSTDQPATIHLLIGPTACGKSAAALELAQRTSAELLSVDSMKVYRRLNIGVAKPSQEEQTRVKHHLINIREPWESYSAAEWLPAAESLIRSYSSQGKPLLAEGGTSMYIKMLREGLFIGPGKDEALRAKLELEAEKKGLPVLFERLKKIDPAAGKRIQAQDPRRIIRALEVFELTGKPISDHQVQWGRLRKDLTTKTVCLVMDRPTLYQRIDNRIDRMLERGWIDECEQLLALENPLSREAKQALGYRTLFAHLQGDISLPDARNRICWDTHHFARRQLNWFRGFKNTIDIQVTGDESAEELADQIAKAFAL